MRPDIGRLVVERIVVHKIPKRMADDDSELRVTDVESELDDDLRKFFKDRISDSLLNSAYEIVLDPDSDSPAPQLILDHLVGADETFVEMSQALARHLHAVQKGSSPSGILAVISAKIAGGRCLVVLKLEWYSGVRVEETDDDGVFGYTIEQVKDLMMTERTKVYKAGAFVIDGDGFGDVSGVVADLQRQSPLKTDVAHFFLSKFLGCRLRTSADQTTKDFYFAAHRYFDEHVPDPQLKAKYHLSLVSTLDNNDATVDPFRFAEQNLIGGHRQGLMNWLRQEGAPADPFPKDNAQIAQKLKRTVMSFENGLVITGKPEEFEKRVVVRPAADGDPVTEVHDKVKSFNA